MELAGDHASMRYPRTHTMIQAHIFHTYDPEIKSRPYLEAMPDVGKLSNKKLNLQTSHKGSPDMSQLMRGPKLVIPGSRIFFPS